MSGEGTSGEGTAGEGTSGPESEEPTPEQRRALFRVVRGTPDDVELAALTSVLAAAASAGGAEHSGDRQGDRQPGNLWADRLARMRAPVHPGPGAWQASTLPR